MAAEQYANAAEASAKSDVFSLAVILWFMLTGELPWGLCDTNVLYHLQRTVIPTPPPKDVMPAAVAKILLRCLAVDPDDRPTMQELATELAAAVAATNDAPSGSEILMHIARRFMERSADHVRTVPHPVGSPEGVAGRLWPRTKNAAAQSNQDDGRLPPLNVDTQSREAPPSDAVNAAEVPASPVLAPEVPVLALVPDVTARVSPRALATPLAFAQRAAASPAASGPAAALPAAEPEPSEPVLVRAPQGIARPPERVMMAAMPTGLISQRYVAPVAPAAGSGGLPRVRSIVTAAEINLADGTPGPQPYAHASLPAVVVRTTQLSGIEPPSHEEAAHPRKPEPPPFVVLPVDSRPVASGVQARSKRAVLVAAASVLVVVVASIAVVRIGSNASRSDGSGGPGSAARDVEHRTSAAVATSDPRFSTSTVVPGADAGLPVRQEADANTSTDPRTRPESAAALDAGSSIDAQAPAPASTYTSHGVASSNEGKPPPAAAQPADTRGSAQGFGELVISVNPWAAVWVNGKPAPLGTPYREKLPAGRYRLRLANDDLGQNENVMVTIEPHKTITIERKW
jgi:hypothetical protein